jgi:hypothetical protein
MDDFRRRPPMEGFSRPGGLGGEAVDDDVVEGHIMDERTENPGDTDWASRRRIDDEDTEGHAGLKRRLDDDDTEGHGVGARKLDDDDTEGHGIGARKVGDDDDVEGHGTTKRS